MPLDNYILGGLSLSQDQIFSILDFSPNWAYGSEIKVLVMGRLLKSKKRWGSINKWAFVFGELEVPAEVISDVILRSLAWEWKGPILYNMH